MDEHKLGDIMSTDILSVGPHSTLNEITHLMTQQSYSCLLVVQNKKPIGIITERDIVRYISESLNNNLQYKSKSPLAADLMTYNLIMLQEDQDILDALVVSIANKVRHLPIVDLNGYLTGIVTYTDIANFQRSILESQSAIIESCITERTSELVKANQRLKEMTLLDPLLGIGNRRAMEIDIKCTHDLSKRYENSYAIAMIDIDNFKLYNDHYGHQAGDEALQKVTHSIKSSIRSTDRIYRYGGEELLVLLPQTKIDGAKELGQRMLCDLKSQKIPHCKSSHDFVTVSCGICIYQNDNNKGKNNWLHIIRTADDALYTAKNEGRNQVSIKTSCAI